MYTHNTLYEHYFDSDVSAYFRDSSLRLKFQEFVKDGKRFGKSKVFDTFKIALN